ncbi:hypothetical protein RGU39_21115 [Bacillus wiedmannii]|uniref:NACHT domain-containing protein n=1 Tax=Bacillus wiedmannii TaxID=1890302 RepID=UPI002852FEE7|nr:NACHT domain-containing protein [Bacillus wiedmannii]MDR4943062.1 hypothetical protein [Bacillus wiedmannii]
MKKQQLKKLIAIVQANEQGTAFLIDRKRALTAGHVVENLKPGQELDLDFITLNVRKKAVFTQCVDADLALLTLNDPIDDSIELEFPLLYAYKIEEDDEKQYSSFGYPKLKETDGQPLSGQITNIINRPNPNDLELTCMELNNNLDMEGLSGSPLVIEDGIHGIIVTIDHLNRLGAVSFHRSIPFLQQFGIPFELNPPLLPFEEAILSSGEQLDYIGYEEGENLPFQETMAFWRTLSDKIGYEENYDTNLYPLIDMINMYYNKSNVESLQRIFFLVADFGKGKSTFLKNYTATLAKKYRLERKGIIPVYFNLREFNDYDSPQNEYGCIGSYLNQLCGYDVVNDPVFRERQFMFLIDSLDESGSLDQQHIQSVIRSVKRINRLGGHNLAKSRLIVASRPISGVLEKIIAQHEPIEDEHGRGQVASIYGFTSEQRDLYFYQLREHLDIECAPKFNQEIIRHIKRGDSIANLLNDVITEEEWRRPILAYMIFKLLQQHKEIQQGHRVSVYLSFINLLTKEAKHVGSKEMETKPINEITHRNLLYATAIMWMRNKSQSGTNYLYIQDIIDIWGIPNAANYRFLSHSYLEKNQDKYFFNHQSFAEMLLAEYYLRVFLYGAFQSNVEIDKIRTMLLIGEPTPQIISFYKGLLDLLIESIEESTLSETNLLDCRKMLFPIIASLGLTKEQHRIVSDLEMDSYLYCEEINQFFSIDELQAYRALNDSQVRNWPITKQVLKKMIKLSQDIIGAEAEHTPLIVKPTDYVPYSNAGRVSETRMWQTYDLDRWLALITGERCNAQFLDSEEFLDKITSRNVMTMLKSHTLATNYAHPSWINCISGLSISDAHFELAGLSFQSIDIIGLNNQSGNLNLSGANIKDAQISTIHSPNIRGNGLQITNCYLGNIAFPKSDINGSQFLGSTLDNVNFYGTLMHGVKIHECILYGVNLESVELFGSEITANYFINIISMKNIRLSGYKMWNWIDKESFERCEEDIRKYRKLNFEIISMDRAEEVIEQQRNMLRGEFENKQSKLLKYEQFCKRSQPMDIIT